VLEGNEEFNFDEVSFKPLTKGLGFHKKDSPKAIVSNTQVKPPPIQNKFKGNQVLPSKGQESLGTFYEHSNIWPGQIENDSAQDDSELDTTDQAEFCEALFFEKFSSFMVDFLIITALTSVTFLSFFYFSPIKASDVTSFLASVSFLKAFFILFSVYFITYFSFLDLDRTPGKTLFNLKLVDLNGGQLTFKNTFLRSLITLSSFLVAFLPLIVDFHGKLSDSKLVKNEQKSH